MNILEEIENQFNPIVFALNFKIDALISTLNKEQLDIYQQTLNEKKEEVKSKLNGLLTTDQLDSILTQMK
ncbi:MAG TPA: hypothetical protein VF985_01455 [Mariniflexile sp.]